MVDFAELNRRTGRDRAVAKIVAMIITMMVVRMVSRRVGQTIFAVSARTCWMNCRGLVRAISLSRSDGCP